jgi:rare lipoprotein A
MRKAISLLAAIIPGWLLGPTTAKADQCKASWYGESYRGKPMANGEQFDPDRRTCASWYWPLGTVLRVTHRNVHGIVRSVFVTVTDRGPDKRLGRKLDLSRAAFAILAPLEAGVINVNVEVAL